MTGKVIWEVEGEEDQGFSAGGGMGSRTCSSEERDGYWLAVVYQGGGMLAKGHVGGGSGVGSSILIVLSTYVC